MLAFCRPFHWKRTTPRDDRDRAALGPHVRRTLPDDEPAPRVHEAPVDVDQFFEEYFVN